MMSLYYTILNSIDDNEVQALRYVMDEIFGAQNFITTVLWQKVFAPKNTARHFSEDHDYVVVYAKRADAWVPNLIPRSEEEEIPGTDAEPPVAQMPESLSKERTAERLADLVAEAHRLVIEELSARQLHTDALNVAIEVPPMLTAKVSRVSIVMVFRNVVKNACEAILDRNDRFRGAVKVTARELDSSLIEIVISDTGPGLEPSELDQVRDFLPGKTSKKYVGTGFGLPIARRNLRAHGGSIQIDSAPEEGTRVTMFLPQDPREEVAA